MRLIVALLVFIVIIVDTQSENEETEVNEYRVYGKGKMPQWCYIWQREFKHSKATSLYIYASALYEEELSTKTWSHFCYNMCYKDRHNANSSSTYTKTMNKFAFVNPTQFNTERCGTKVPDNVATERVQRGKASAAKTTTTTPSPTSSNAPPSLLSTTQSNWPVCNWSKYTGPVRDQGSCGSCWAFAANQVTGAQACIRNNGVNPATTNTMTNTTNPDTSTTLWPSEQNLVDCLWNTPSGDGCNGGWMGNAWQYSKDQNGLYSIDDYPYTATQNACNAPANPKVCPVGSYSMISDPGNTASGSYICDYVCKNGPVAVAILASTGLQFYDNFLYSCTNQGSDVDHGVTCVGCTWTLDKNNNNVYAYIIKNSWGPNWGNAGSFYLSTNSSIDCNCHLYPCTAALA